MATTVKHGKCRSFTPERKTGILDRGRHDSSSAEKKLTNLFRMRMAVLIVSVLVKDLSLSADGTAKCLFYPCGCFRARQTL